MAVYQIQAADSVDLAVKRFHNYWAMAKAIRADPAKFLRDEIQITLWSRQEEALWSVFNNRRTAMASGHSVGKTFLLPCVVLCWILSHPFSYVVITAGGGWDGVKEIFQGLISICRNLPFPAPTEPNTGFWRLAPKWAVLGRSPKRAEPMQGHHSQGINIEAARYLADPGIPEEVKAWIRELLGFAGTLFVADEASGVEPLVHIAIVTQATAPGDSILYLGNPLKVDGPFTDAIHGGAAADWNVITVPSTETPNFDPALPDIEGLATPLWEKSIAKEFGRDSVEYKVRVLGLPPDQTEMTLISIADIKAAADHPRKNWIDDGPLKFGIDPARSEVGDRTGFAVRGETTLHHLEGVRGMTQNAMERRIKEILEAFDGHIDELFVDGNGVGSGICDRLQADPRVPVTRRCMGAYRAHNADLFPNQRSESYVLLKKALPGLHIPVVVGPKTSPALKEEYDCQRHLVRELGGTEFEWDTMERQQVETKKKMKKRTDGVKSPDHADPVRMTYVRPVGHYVFAMMRKDVHVTGMQPEVYQVDGKWMLYMPRPGYEDLGRGDADRAGVLARTVWIDRIDQCAAIWVHIDTSKGPLRGTWTAYDAIVADTQPTMFWKEVLERRGRRGERYRHSIVGALGEHEDPRVRDVIEELMDIDAGQQSEFIAATRIAGQAGLSRLERMAISSLAFVAPDDEFFGDTDAKDFEDTAIFMTAPEMVFNALNDARYVERAGSQSGEALAEARQELVGGGGPVVRCLRMLSIAA